jgi:adenylate cyclase
MSEVFISYARSTEPQARAIGDALRALGYGVWRDDELPAHRAYADVIEERLRQAKAVVVVWSAEAIRSQWVRSEAERARSEDKLVQLAVDDARLPMPFDQTQCADMNGWSGDLASPGWLKVVARIDELVRADASSPAAKAAPQARKLSICVLPFANMSGDAEQEYFSDGISEDIITDLSKVSALFVIARNNAFTFKGKTVEVQQVARQFGVSHVLEGSVRKAGARVRITAQLIDGATGGHVWAERYDRELDDIFALQDEISEAIVAALKLKLLPEEKKAIERRGTDDPEAYDLYLMARRHMTAGNEGDPRREEAVIRLCRRATELDPGYALAWALMGRAQIILRFRMDRRDIDSWAAVEKALALDPNLAEARALKASHLRHEDRLDEALAEAKEALRLDPESHAANDTAASIYFGRGQFADCVPYYEKAVTLAETNFSSLGMLITCYTVLGDGEGMRRTAQRCLARTEAALAQDAANGAALAYGAQALAILGQAERARDWVRRALLIDPDNQLMRYNLACALCVHLKDSQGALDLLGPYFASTMGINMVAHAKVDPDMDSLRDDPRFQAMIAEAEARLAAAG